LENDLSGAIGRADADNLENLVEIMGYVYNHTPGGCWGSPRAVTLWLLKGGLK